MAKSRDINSWDGFDGGEIVYDDKAEKVYHSKIWIVLGGIAALILISLCCRLGSEIMLKMNGNSIEAEYCKDASKIYAWIYADDGKTYSVNLEQYFAPVHNGDSITLYYYDDITQAKPISQVSAWVGYFSFFGLILGISAWRLHAIWRPKSHVSKEE